MKKILHQLNLDTVGGVEQLFKNYISSSDQIELQHDVLVSNRRINPIMRQAVEKKVGSVRYLKYKGPFKLPKSLREGNATTLIDRASADSLCYWNSASFTVDAVQKRGLNYCYYDHGLSWLHPDCPKYRSFLQRANTIIACGFSAKRMMQLRWDVPAEQIITVPNGVRPEALPLHIAPKTFVHDRPLRLGVAGRFIPLKGTAIAIHMLKALRTSGVDASLHIAGDGSERECLVRLAKELDLESHVVFLGVIDDMQQFYQDMDFFISPTLRDPFPLVAIEAVSAGCVPIATAVDGYPDIVEHGVTGFCVEPELPLSDYPGLGGSLHGIPSFVYDPKTDALSEPKLPDPVHMAQVIIGLVGKPDTYTEMSQRGIEAGKNRFAFTDYVSALDAALLEA